MTKKELETLQELIDWADGYFESYCDLKDVCVYTQAEIDAMDDDVYEKEEAQENRDYRMLLKRAQKIIRKYNK